MVRLDTIFEVGTPDEDELLDIAEQGSLKLELELFQDASSLLFGKKSDDLNFTAQAAERLELCEPECELDPCCTEVSERSAMAKSKKNRRSGARRGSLIDKAFKLQQKPRPQGAHENSRQQLEPAYIQISDLAADLSRYFTDHVTTSSLDLASVSPYEENVDVREVAVKTKRKRNRSLIDKAYRRELEEAKSSQRQLQQQQASKVANAYSALRGTRMTNGSDDTVLPRKIHLPSDWIPMV